MITDYRNFTGPMYDDDCQCHCSEERNRFQSALDEIHVIIDGKNATSLTDTDLDEIRKWVDER